MSARSRVLSAFKELHRTCQSVYAGHKRTLRSSRWKINTEFKRYKDETEPKRIESHIQLARDASRLIRLTAVQGEANDYWQENTGPIQTNWESRPANSSSQPHRKPYRNHHNNNRFYDDDNYLNTRYSSNSRADRQSYKSHNYAQFDEDDDISHDYQDRPRKGKQSYKYRNYDSGWMDEDDDDSDSQSWRKQHRNFQHQDDWFDDNSFPRSRGKGKYQKRTNFVDSANIDFSAMTRKR